MKKTMIATVPDIRYDGNEVEYVFHLLTAVLQSTGDQTSLSELAVYSGMANRFVWIPGSWSRGCECLGSIDETPHGEIMRLLKWYGWKAEGVKVLRDNHGTPLHTDHERIRSDYMCAIDNGFPVMSLSVKNHRFNAVIGYDNDGRTIICKEGVDGANNIRACETVSRDQWEETISDYILLKEKQQAVLERVRFLALLKLIVSRAKRTDKINDKMLIGFAAWDAYLDMLEHEDLGGLSNDEVGDILGKYCDGLCQIWGRNSGLAYYRSVAERFPEWKTELETAVAALDICANYGGFLWSQGIGWEGEGLEKFRSKEGRKILAEEGRRAMQKDKEAIEQFEKILEKENR